MESQGSCEKLTKDEEFYSMEGGLSHFCTNSSCTRGIEVGAQATSTIATVGINTLHSSVTLVDSFHGVMASSGDEPSTESRMCTEESIERMTSSTDGMLSLSEDSSGKDTYAQAHDVGQWNAASRIYKNDAVEPSVEFDDSDEQMNGILGSYREILPEDEMEGETYECNVLVGEDTEEEVSNLSCDSGPSSPTDVANYVLGDSERPELYHLEQRPNSLKLNQYETATQINPSSKQHDTEAEWKRIQKRELECLATVASEHMADSISGLEGLVGVLSREGDLVSFVAQDLQEQIKRSSPVVKKGDTSFTILQSSTTSLHKMATIFQLQSVDPNILQDIETIARIVASSVETILENLLGTLHSMSSLTVDCVDVYEEVVNKTCDSVDGNIKGMYQLMAKFEELGNLMRPIYRLSGHIKEIKRMLDLFEQVVSSGSS